MKKTKKTFKKALLLLPAAFAIALTVVFSLMSDYRLEQQFQTKLVEKRDQVDLIANDIDYLIAKDNDWATYDYESMLASSVEFIDAQYMVFAAGYNQDFRLIGQRTKSEAIEFNPLGYPEFIDAVLHTENGTIGLWFEDEITGVVGREMMVYYRWIPSNVGLSNRYLITVGISRMSVEHVDTAWVGIVFAFSTVILNYSMIGYMMYLRGKNG